MAPCMNLRLLTLDSTVWLGIMLPVLGIKSLSPFAIAHLDRLLL